MKEKRALLQQILDDLSPRNKVQVNSIIVLIGAVPNVPVLINAGVSGNENKEQNRKISEAMEQIQDIVTELNEKL